MGNRIKELRKEKKITQAELSKFLNIDQTTVSKWELEKAFPDSKILSILADYFNVSIDYLLNRTSFFFPNQINEKLTDDEKELLNVYRKMSFSDKAHVRAYAEVRLEESEEKTNKIKR